MDGPPPPGARLSANGHDSEMSVDSAAGGVPAAVRLETNGTSASLHAAQPNGISAGERAAPRIHCVRACGRLTGRGFPDEIALYDRQIRLWGMQAQEKIRSANVLLVTMKALANEIAKNLVLAGIGSLTVVDHETVTEADLGAQFFLSAEDGHVGMNRAEAASGHIRRLNPRVKVHTDREDIRAKPPAFFQPFDVVIATDLDTDALGAISAAARAVSRPFYAAGTHGMYGFIFSDLIEHDFAVQRQNPNKPTEVGPETRTRSVVAVRSGREEGKTVETVTKRELYSAWPPPSVRPPLPAEHTNSARRLRSVTPALSCLRALWLFQQREKRLPGRSHDDMHAFTRLATEEHAQLRLPDGTLRSEFLRSFLQGVGAEFAPVTAILGGQLAQDVINVLGRTQHPIQNTVIFDGNAMEASMYALHPDGPLGAQPSATAAGELVNGHAVPLV